MGKQILHQSLQQKLSPQQIQLMKLIELSTLEIEQKVKEEIETNPALDDEKIISENEFNDDSCVVIVFPDHGSRYLSKIYSDEWMNNQGFYDSSFYQPKKNTINYI